MVGQEKKGSFGLVTNDETGKMEPVLVVANNDGSVEVFDVLSVAVEKETPVRSLLFDGLEEQFLELICNNSVEVSDVLSVAVEKETPVRSLPFDEYEEQFLNLVRSHQVLILAAETGAGKSTKAPLALLEAGFGGNKLIGVSEPRRPAATMLADWVSELHGTELGSVIGYQIGQDRTLGSQTRLAYLTEGVILNQLHKDPLLSRYSILVLDEVHERGVNQDLLMALMKNLLLKRPDLKVVVMSATIDTDKFSRYFGNAPVLMVPGRVFPVEVRYAGETPENGGMVKAMIEKILEILHGNEPGDILAFLPDQATIMQVVSALEKEMEHELSRYRFLPLYGTQAPDDQKEVFNVDHRRRIIVATNIAETSLTIDGVRHVVDSGQIKATVYVDASMSALQVTEHSRAGCDQRKGRAGRTQDGICHRLFSQEDFESRVAFTKPEILRMSLDQVLLDLRCLKYTLEEILALDLMDTPMPEQWKDAEARLKLLGALGADGEVTKDGVRMRRFHVEPMIGRMILEGEKYGCLDEVITIAACLADTKPIFIAPKDKREEARRAKKGFDDPNSDLLTFLKVWRGWDRTGGNHRWARENYLSSRALSQVDRLRNQLMNTLKQENVPYSSSQDTIKLRKAVAAGLIVNIAQKSGRYNYSWNDRTTFISPGSALFGDDPPELLVCTKAMGTTSDRGTKTYMHGCHMIDVRWLPELVPVEACKTVVSVARENIFSSGAEVFVYCRTWNGIELERKTLETIPETLIPSIAAFVAMQLSDGFGFFVDNASQLAKLWRQNFPTNGLYVYGEERRKRIQPYVDQFTKAIAKKIVAESTPELVVAAMNTITSEDILTGDALKAYQAEHAAELQREREVAAERVRREEEARQAEHAAELQREREAAAERVRREEEARQAREKVQAEFAPLREEFAVLDARVRALGYVFDYSSGKRMEFSDNNQREITRGVLSDPRGYGVDHARHELGRYRAVVERLEREYAERLERERIDRAECIVVRSNVIRLPKSLVEDKELIEIWLGELDEAKKALEAELAFVADLKRKVTSGEVICLTFKDRGNGTMVAEYKRELVDAPYGDDLSRYPNDGESWWCHVIPGYGSTKISLYRKVGKTKVDVERVLKDGLDMFPGLPTQLLQ